MVSIDKTALRVMRQIGERIPLDPRYGIGTIGNPKDHPIKSILRPEIVGPEGI